MTRSSHETTVLLADDYPLIRYGLQQALKTTPDFRVVAEARDGEEALSQLRSHQPDIAVLDIELPQQDGFRIAAAAQHEGLPTKIVLFSSNNQASFLQKALRLNVPGFILKDSALAEILTGLRVVAKGRPYFSPAAMMHMITPPATVSQMRGSSVALTVEMAQLTPTEKAILKLVGECCTTKEIAAQLFISPRTVDTHRANICQKLGVRGNHALTKFALAQTIPSLHQAAVRTGTS